MMGLKILIAFLNAAAVPVFFWVCKNRWNESSGQTGIIIRPQKKTEKSERAKEAFRMFQKQMISKWVEKPR